MRSSPAALRALSASAASAASLCRAQPVARHLSVTRRSFASLQPAIAALPPSDKAGWQQSYPSPPRAAAGAAAAAQPSFLSALPIDAIPLPSLPSSSPWRDVSASLRAPVQPADFTAGEQLVQEQDQRLRDEQDYRITIDLRIVKPKQTEQALDYLRHELGQRIKFRRETLRGLQIIVRNPYRRVGIVGRAKRTREYFQELGVAYSEFPFPTNVQKIYVERDMVSKWLGLDAVPAYAQQQQQHGAER